MSQAKYEKKLKPNPERAAALFDKAEKAAAAKFERLEKMGKLYE